LSSSLSLSLLVVVVVTAAGRRCRGRCWSSLSWSLLVVVVVVAAGRRCRGRCWSSLSWSLLVVVVVVAVGRRCRGRCSSLSWSLLVVVLVVAAGRRCRGRCSSSLPWSLLVVVVVVAARRRCRGRCWSSLSSSRPVVVAWAFVRVRRSMRGGRFGGSRGGRRAHANPGDGDRVIGGPGADMRTKGFGFIGATCLVAGNMIGSGIFVMPASLAEAAGPLSLLGWPIAAVAFLALTGVFADLGEAYPVSGGPSAFVGIAFGRAPALVVTVLYWICIVIGNAAFVTAFVGYLGVLWPVLREPLPAFVAGQALLWSLTGVNALGVRAASALQVATTILKVLPLLVLVAVLAPRADAAHLEPFAPQGIGGLFPALSMCAWMFVGSESITAAGAEVDGGGRSIKRAAYAGFLVATLVYMLVGVTVDLAFDPASLARDPAPLANAAFIVLGHAGAVAVTVAALISVGGVLNGWLVVAARTPLPAVEARLMPAFMGKTVPALLVSSSITSILIASYFVKALLDAYNFIALFSTATALAAIGAACVALLVLTDEAPARFAGKSLARVRATATFGALVIGLMIVGSGIEVIALTALLAAVATVYAVVMVKRVPSLAPAPTGDVA
jgi:APA family basic amino acid/polyamine antiporter